MKTLIPLLWLVIASASFRCAAEEQRVSAELLVVGGTESGCAAAVQAARMGIRRIVLVNDIEWLGGQFTAEALGAIDENRAEGYNGRVPIPRSGIFREVIDAIERKNAQLYGGVKRPGNTRVITTARPIVAEEVFRELLKPYEASGQIKRFSNFQVQQVKKRGQRLVEVQFRSTTDSAATLRVSADMTIDASDWGDVIKLSGARYDVGIDARDEFQEPSAPLSPDPKTDLNPITWCMILVQQPRESLTPRPEGYDPASFQGKWGWIKEDFAYTTRRLVDGQGEARIDHPDVLLINNPNIDYPLDQHTAKVTADLEATERGAAQKNLIDMTPSQRQIVLADAKSRSLQYLFYLQQNFPKFRRLALSDEFGTPDRLPPKPYIRESLRLVARHMVKEQEVLGFGERSHYAATMFPDAVFCWQFELDFHPTARRWTSEAGSAGPWEADFRGDRRFGNGGTGRAVFPLRSFVPETVSGLLGAQKNLGMTSIVLSSCRLHDQSIAAGQACGAVAATSLKSKTPPADICFKPKLLAQVWSGLLEDRSGVPIAIWPFADLDPYDRGFAAIQQLALRRLLPLGAEDIEFRPGDKASQKWQGEVLQRLKQAGLKPPKLPPEPVNRRQLAILVWDAVEAQPQPPRVRKSPTDADGDKIPDDRDPLPFTPGTVSWKTAAQYDGLPDLPRPFGKEVEAFNFTSRAGQAVKGFVNDHGARYTDQAGFGWLQDLSTNHRLRRLDREAIRDGFVFTRKRDSWQRRVKNGRYRVTVCVGDSGFPQPGQRVQVEDKLLAENVSTQKGSFRELTVVVDIKDGFLTLTIGKAKGGSNTTVNWLIFAPHRPE